MSTGEIHPGPPPSPPLRWYYVAATGFAILFVMLGIWSAVTTWSKSVGVDFVSFWAAGRLTLGGHASAAYDIAQHHKVEQLVAPHVGLIPFPYPPPFLFLVTPFALAPFGLAFTLWSGVTAAFYAFAASRAAPLRFAFSIAPACVDFMIAQSGFLMCGMFILGLTLIASAPFMAGAVLGLLILKPQMALLLPIAMLAGREWRVIGGAVASSTVALFLGLIVFGAETYQAFWNILPHYVGYMRDSRLPWYQIASPFGLARFSGVPQTAALTIHFLIAVTATALTARAWWLKLDARIPILAASTMLISPYFFTYDSLLIIVPIGWLLRHNIRPGLFALIWALTFFPIITSLSPWYVPNTMSLAAITCLYALHFETVTGRSRENRVFSKRAVATR
jgi:hypothetical protein